jgi:hypothetical protein
MRGALATLPLLLALGCDAEGTRSGGRSGTTAPAATGAGRGSTGGVGVAAFAPPVKGSVVACAGLPFAAADDHGDGALDATPLPLGQAGQGALEGPADADWFAIGLAKGRRYRVEALGLVPPTLGLVGPDGRRELAAAPPGEAALELLAPADGVDFVRLNTPAGAPSPLPYTLVCEPLAPR